ncbi:MAG: DUF456 domain-containing protein [Bacteroidales bacterium]
MSIQVMDILWIIIGTLLLIIGFIFCILPVLPGQVLSYASLLLLQLTNKKPFESDFLFMMAFIMIGVTVLDYIVPVVGTRKFGGTRRGTYGSMIGLVISVIILPILGITIGPFGILGLLLGPFLGAYIGESSSGRDSKEALRAAFGSFIGFLAGTLMKITFTVIVAFYFFTNL